MDNRVYPDKPLVGVGALVLHGDKVLLVKRANEPCSGYWSIPGGLVEVGETLEEAVLRELWEETGVRGFVEGVIWVDEVIIRDDSRVKYHYILIDFLVKPETLETKPSTDVKEAKWYRIEEALEKLRLTKTTKKLLETIKKQNGKPKLLKK